MKFGDLIDLVFGNDDIEFYVPEISDKIHRLKSAGLLPKKILFRWGMRLATPTGTYQIDFRSKGKFMDITLGTTGSQEGDPYQIVI